MNILQADAEKSPICTQNPFKKRVSRRFFYLILGWLLFAMAADLFMQRNILNLSGPTAMRNLHHNDFRHSYAAASLLRSGGNIYDPEQLRAEASRRGIERLNPYVYPPLQAVLFLPLTALSFQQAGLAWYFINLLCVAIVVMLLAEMTDVNAPWSLWIVTLILATSEPLTRTLTAGQMNLVLLLLITLAFTFLKDKKEISGGILIGIAAALKVFPALLIVMLFWRRRWRAGWAALGSAVVLTLVSSAVAGFSNSFEYLHLLRQMSYGSSTWAQYGMHYHIDPANQSVSAFISRLLTIDPESGVMGVASLPKLAKALSNLSALIFLALCFLIAYPRKNQARPTEIECLALTLLTALLVPSLLWDHYLVMAVLPAIVLVVSWQKRISPVKILLVALALFLINVPYRFWNPDFNQGWRVALTSVKLPGMLILYGLFMLQCFKKVQISTSNRETGE